MFSKCNIAGSCAAFMDFDLWEIIGSWVSLSGAPAVHIYRDTSRKPGSIRLCLTYNHPQAVCDCTVYSVPNMYYINLYGRIGIAYDREREVLLLCAFGEYVRAEE